MDLITKYKQKNYKVRDLSLKNNLFEPSPLLMENNKIVDEYRFGDNAKIYMKDLKFVMKTTNQLYDNKSDLEELKDKMSSRDIKAYQKLDEAEKSKTKLEYLDNIKATKQYIRQSTIMIQDNEFKTLFDESKSNALKPSTQKINNFTSRNSPKPKRQRVKKPVFLPVVKYNKKLLDNSKEELTQNSILTTENSTVYTNTITSMGSEKKQNRTRTTTVYTNTTPGNDKKLTNRTILVKENDLALSENEEENVKKKIVEDINNRIEEKYSKIRNLENTFDKVVSEREPVNTILNYYEKELGKDRKHIEDSLNRKLEPSDIMKFIQELKNKVNSLDLYETYEKFASRYGNIIVNSDDFNKIKEFDNNINKMDLMLVKKLNKLNKGMANH